MRRRVRLSIEDLIQAIDASLRGFREEYAGLTLRQKVLRLVELFSSTKSLGIEVARADGCDAEAAMERIRLYLVQHVGIVVDGRELEVVAGISEYGRRIRQLRVEDGYKILTGASNDPEVGINLGPSDYLLIRAEPDTEAARRWYLANRIRKEPGTGAQTRILKYLQASVGQIVTTEELAYVGKAREFGRRVRELRTEDGYAIATRVTGRPDLRPGEYVLESKERVAEPHDRHIPHEVQQVVYQRDNNTCRLCGWNRDKWTREDPRILELHHVVHHKDGGANNAENLLVLCNRCHDDVHAGRVHIEL
jgi:hypothetical protein